MNIIGIDTTTNSFCIGLIDNKEILSRRIVKSKGFHSEEFLFYLEAILKERSLNKEDIDGYAISIGPGSLTGIRVGLAFLKGIAFAVGKPVVPVKTLYAIAYEFRKGYEYICPIISTRKNKVFSALYRFNPAIVYKSQHNFPNCEGIKKKRDETIIEQICIGIEELLDCLPEKNILFVGNGALKYKSELEGFCNTRVHFERKEITHPDPVVIAEIGLMKIKEGNLPPVDKLEPVYL